MREMTIGKNDAGQRLDKFLQKALPSLPPSLMHKYVRLKRIKCNGKRCQTSARLTEGDVLSLYINDEFFQPVKEEEAFRRITPRLHILYEDDHILLCDKRPGMVVHEDDQGTLDTLINHIKAYLYEKGEWDPDKEQSFTPALCNRIDRQDSGRAAGTQRKDPAAPGAEILPLPGPWHPLSPAGRYPGYPFERQQTKPGAGGEKEYPWRPYRIHELQSAAKPGQALLGGV